MADEDQSTEPKRSGISLSGCAPIALLLLVMYVGAFVVWGKCFVVGQLPGPIEDALTILFWPLGRLFWMLVFSFQTSY